jgi:predicted alpha/beta-hydrolase family hydrolase
MILAHIAGMPIEETALSLGPALAAGGGIATLKLRERFARRRRRRRRQTESWRSS